MEWKKWHIYHETYPITFSNGKASSRGNFLFLSIQTCGSIFYCRHNIFYLYFFIYYPSLKCYLGSSWLCTRPGPMVLRCSIKYKVAPGESGHSTAHFEHRALNCCPQVWCYQNLKSISKEMGVWVGI